MKKLIFVPIHGVEIDLSPDYANEFTGAILSAMSPTYNAQVVPQPFNWNVLVADLERQTWEMEKDLSLPKLRKTIINLVCDIVWYMGAVKEEDAGVRSKVLKKLDNEMIAAKEKHGKDALLVLCGHSLGSQVALDYCFAGSVKVDGLITMGSPITKFSGMFPKFGRLPDKPLDFWINFYKSRDLVSAWFKCHKQEQFKNFVEDFDVTSMNPLKWLLLNSHTIYWSNSFVHKTIAGRLESYMAERCY